MGTNKASFSYSRVHSQECLASWRRAFGEPCVATTGTQRRRQVGENLDSSKCTVPAFMISTLLRGACCPVDSAARSSRSLTVSLTQHVPCRSEGLTCPPWLGVHEVSERCCIACLDHLANTAPQHHQAISGKTHCDILRLRIELHTPSIFITRCFKPAGLHAA